MENTGQTNTEIAAQIEILGFLIYRAKKGHEDGDNPTLVSDFAVRAALILESLSGTVNSLIIRDVSSNNDDDDMVPDNAVDSTPSRKRGRPPGSKKRSGWKSSKDYVPPEGAAVVIPDKFVATDKIIDRILAVIQKKPSSALEIAKSAGLELNQVYPTTQTLKSRNIIEGYTAEDGTRRWYLKGTAPKMEEGE